MRRLWTGMQHHITLTHMSVRLTAGLAVAGAALLTASPNAVAAADADFQIWRNHLGAASAAVDPDVDADDFLVWRRG